MDPLTLIGIAGLSFALGGAATMGIVAYAGARARQDEAQEYTGDAIMLDRPEHRAPLVDRLADCLADCIDTALLTTGDPDFPPRKIELRLGCFRPDLGERAAELLEEAGR